MLLFMLLANSSENFPPIFSVAFHALESGPDFDSVMDDDKFVVVTGVLLGTKGGGTLLFKACRDADFLAVSSWDS